MITRRSFLGAFAATALAGNKAFATPAAVFAEDGYAIHGIDPVSYFRNDAPIAGRDAYRLMWRKAIWRFENATNMAAFEAAPRAFAPRYGGYCAMSLINGQWSPSDPDAWTIHQGRLYLTHSVPARDQWRKDPERFIAMADAHWRAAHW
ncbi:YHS domain-containing (seleno)protein [Cognatiyoonia sp. IB215182]|uniref:YHS domain-containing (seleno)protein n=1 Tax=Cognatiyoonia sp. IB215182 TaxID=3097353 RepID=UPI002A0B4EF7|nr:YHS domain-containing (seleno)protein [Cognatiyoonia sp. IB215182]MDX8351266.1 YHS domain-containing (seleno)protein [Cognatiyoonia sp. IB215182]